MYVYAMCEVSLQCIRPRVFLLCLLVVVHAVFPRANVAKYGAPL